MSNRFKYLILILAIVFLFLPKPTFAFLGIGDFGLTDIPDQILGGIEERTGPIFTAIVAVFAFYVIGLASLALSSNFLESFITQQSDWLIKIEPMTQAGWNFTAGLANMLLVLIFLIIAFAFIFKIETFQAKKALPKLIIVALLLNFSLLFVQMLVDITQIIYNTILPDESLFATVMAVFIGSGKAVVISVVAWIAALGVAWSIPFVNAFAQIIFSTLFTAIILPNIIVWAIQAAFFFLLSSMFLFFIFLFGARVFVIQILGILAPLAFLCLILPQTKSFWSQWFKFLLEWLLLGIFFLFFLVLGFGVVSLLAPDVGPVPIPGFALFNLGGHLVYYFALFIYMAVILFIGKKFIPSGAQALIDFGKGVAGTVLTRGLMPLGKGTVAQMREGATQSEAVQKLAQRMAIAPTPGAGIPGLRGRLTRGATSPMWAIGRAMGRAVGPSLIEAEKRNIDAEEKKVAGQRIESQVSAWASARTNTKKIGILNAIIKDRNIEDAMSVARFGNAAIPQAEIEKLYSTAQARDKHSTLRAAFPEIARTHLPAGTPTTPPPPGISLSQHQAQYVFDRIKPADYDNMSRHVLADNEFLEAIFRRGKGQHIQRFIERFGMDGTDALQQTIRNAAAIQGLTTHQWLQNVNPTLYRYTRSQAGQGLIQI